MAERPRIFDDLAGVAGGALSALSGIRDEAEALGRARVDETIRKLDLVKREQFEAVAELACNARNAQEAADGVISSLKTRLEATEAKLADLEARLAALEPKASGGAPGMVV
jgi:BMFP domain-containing protein YqiC